MNSKKAITILVLATLLFNLLPISFVSAALTPVDQSGIVYYDDEVTVTGTGVTPGSKVEIYWDFVQAWNGSAGKVATGTGKPNGAFSVDFDVPEAKGGYHYIWVKDVSTGAIEPSGYVDVEPSIDLSAEYGLAGDDITVTGYGFNASIDVDKIMFGNATQATSKTTGLGETDEYGTWDATFEIPDWDYDDYDVNASANGFWAMNVTFRIGASIAINKDEGPSGTQVRITGRGFLSGVDLTSAEVTFNGTEMYVKDEPVTTDGDGDFVLDAFIPSTGGNILDEYDIVVDDGTNAPTIGFEITGLPDIEATPGFQVQGGSFSLSGLNYTLWADQVVEVWLNDTKLGEVKTKADGTWSKNFKVPAVPSGVYPLFAQMEDFNINSTINFRVGLMLVILSEESGPSGQKISLTANGFTEDGTWNMTIGGKSVNEVGESKNVKGDGSIVQIITVPTLPVGVHTVSVLDIDEDIVVETTYEVTKTTVMEADPFEVPLGFNVTLSGEYFSDEDMDLSLEFWVYNSTGAWELTVYNDTAANIMLIDDGTFEGIWTTGADVNLTIGSYTLNVTDGRGLWAEIPFSIVDKTVSIDPRKTVFRIGDTVAFDIESSFPLEDSYIKIWDPSGSLYWKTEAFEAGVWVELDLTRIVPFYDQTAGGNPMVLLDDAPLGVYTWTWYDVDDEELDDGTFTVEAAAADVIGTQVADLANDIMDLADQLADVTSEFDDVRDDIADVSAIAQQAVTAAQQAAEAVQTVAQTANQANTAAEQAATAAEAARDAANSLTTLVYGAIGAALVAALAAIVSLMQISRRIAG